MNLSSRSYDSDNNIVDPLLLRNLDVYMESDERDYCESLLTSGCVEDMIKAVVILSGIEDMVAEGTSTLHPFCDSLRSPLRSPLQV